MVYGISKTLTSAACTHILKLLKIYFGFHMTISMMRVSDYIFHRLSRAGVHHVFQVTGRGALFLSDALAKNSELNSISLHHEQSCAFAAVAYAEGTGSLGAALVSTGCASTNAMTGVLSAWQDGVPCVFLSGQHVLSETTRYTGIPLRTFGQQEADIVQLVTPITKYAHMLTSPSEIVEVMDKALEAACSGRPGPVWIDVPIDLQSSLISVDVSSEPLGNEHSEGGNSHSEQLEALVDRIRSAERPVLLIGRGARSAGAEALLKQFVERWRIPLTYSASAPDTFGTANELSIGSVGAMGCSRAGNFAVANADLVLVLGSRLNSLTTGTDFCKFAREANVVVVDIDAHEHTKPTVKIDEFIQADLADFLTELLEYAAPPSRDAWVDRCINWKKTFGGIEKHFNSSDEVDLYQFADCLSDSMQAPSTLVTDSGLVEVILPSNMRFRDGMKLIHPVSQGAMGFAIPAAIGAQCASKDPVICVVGDGSIMMNLQELESIRYLRLPIKIFVINNNAYSIIRRRQKDLFRTRTIGTDPSNGVSCPDFQDVARCFGLSYVKIANVHELKEKTHSALAVEGPVLCEVMGREDQDYIEVGRAKSLISGKMVSRPLEDQKPFLDREIFLREMIIDPIDQ